MKILHLASNDKFINHAYHSFESVYPGASTVFIFEYAVLKSQYTPHPAFTIIGYKDILNPAFVKGLEQYDLIVLHSLYPQFISIVNRAPKSVKFVWVGWGFDYYRFIYKDERALYLPETLALFERACQKQTLPQRLLQMLKQPYKKFLKMDEGSRIKAIEKCRAFAPVLEEDYDLVKQAGIIKNLPPFIDWNYGSLEEHWVKGFTGARTDGDHILIGNSSDLENNHLDAFESLVKTEKGADQKVIVPLSYGDGQCIPEVLKKGRTLFGDDLQPLQNFMPIEDYIAIIKSCGFVIMNHKRQQGIGTIVLMLYLGAKVFLQEDCPSTRFFKRHGAVIYTVQQLEKDPALLQSRLPEKDVQNNIAMLEKFWSKRAIENKTRALVETIAGLQKPEEKAA